MMKKLTGFFLKNLNVFIIILLNVGIYSSCFSQVIDSDKPNNIKLPANILTTLNTGHPRLLVKSLQEFEDLKERIHSDEFLQLCSSKILAQANTLLHEDAVSYHIDPQLGGQLLEVSRKLYRRIYILSMSYRLTNDKRYADRAWKELSSASQFPDWNPWHFLDVSEMVHGFAIGYDWLYDVWTPEQRKVIKQAIVDKGLLRGMLAYQGLENKHLVDWPKATSNWNQVCSAGMAMGALAIADEEPPLCNYILRESLSRLPNTMNRLEPDGASEEGPGYWKFGSQYNVLILESLKTALGTDFGLSELKGFAKTGEYFLAMSGANGLAFNYADCWMNNIQASELFWFANRYHQPLLAKYAARHPEYLPVELLWYHGEPKITNDLPLDNYFRFAEVATIRSSWHDPKGWFVGFKAGRNQANHSHLDIGEFVLEKNGKRWAVDLAHDSYALPGYFDTKGKRWSYYRLKAEGHNTLSLNPDKQPDQNILADTKITKFVSGTTSSFGIMDITDAYAGKVLSARRGILMQDKKRIIVQDEITNNKTVADLYWFMQTPAKIAISQNGKTATLSIDDQQMAVEIIGPATAKFEVTDAKPLAASIQPEAESENKNIRRLTIHLQKVQNTTISVVFKEKNDIGSVKVKPLSDWK
jgi:hypothetical protein